MTWLYIAGGWCVALVPLTYGWYRLCIYNDRITPAPVVVYHPKLRLVRRPRAVAHMRGIR